MDDSIDGFEGGCACRAIRYHSARPGSASLALESRPGGSILRHTFEDEIAAPRYR